MRCRWPAAVCGSLLCAAAAARGKCPVDLSTQILPLPVWATLPNEGSTYGVMPVFLRVCPRDKRTDSIIAPSITWNDVIHLSGTFRWFYYPAPDRTLTLIASASTRINSNLLFLWQDAPVAIGAETTEVEARWQRSAFFRFFGLGPDTASDAETSYTRLRIHVAARQGVNIGGHWNTGIGFGVDFDRVQDLGVPGLPITRRVFPDVPGMAGSATGNQWLDLRYDSRPNGENSESGGFASIAAGVVEGVEHSPTYLQGRAQLRWLQPELSWVFGAARLDWRGVSSPSAPFYQQPTLGGAYLLRGFTEDRFIDQGAWTVELEQRVRLFQTHIFGVVADWRADPFVAVGQVYRSLNHAFSKPRLAGGVGFRAWVHPNVLGRIDVASGGEGVKVYVEIGYPY